MANPFDVQVPNILQALTGFDQGYKSSTDMRDRAAVQAAAPLLSQGDYKNALAQMLSSGGNVNSALAVAGLGNQDRNYNFQVSQADRAQNNTDRQFNFTSNQPQYMVDQSNGRILALPKNQEGTPKYINPEGGPSNGGADNGVHGDDYLQTLDPQRASQVKALAEGRMQFPAGFALKSPYFQQMLSQVSQYDPNFDAVNYNARSKTRNDFTSGKSATQINAMNTVMGHLQSLSDAGDKLNNFSFTPLNSVVNSAESLMGDPRYKQFDTTKKAVIDELTRVWRGNGGSEGDIKTWSDQINSANSPAQLHGVIAQIGELLSSKISAMGEQYKQGMGMTKSDLQLITPRSAQVLNVLRQRAGMPPEQVQTTVPSSGVGSQSAQPTQPAQSAIPPAAINALKANPAALRNAFEAKYGQGSADKALGQ